MEGQGALSVSLPSEGPQTFKHEVRGEVETNAKFSWLPALKPWLVSTKSLGYNQYGHWHLQKCPSSSGPWHLAGWTLTKDWQICQPHQSSLREVKGFPLKGSRCATPKRTTLTCEIKIQQTQEKLLPSPVNCLKGPTNGAFARKTALTRQKLFEPETSLNDRVTFLYQTPVFTFP